MGHMYCHPAMSIETVEKTHSTDHNQLHGFILSSSTTGLAMGGLILPLCCRQLVGQLSAIARFLWLQRGHGTVLDQDRLLSDNIPASNQGLSVPSII